MNVITLILLVASSVSSIYESIRHDTVFWTQVIYSTLLFVIVLIVLTSITGPGMGVPPERSLIILQITFALLFLKILYVDLGHVMIVEKFTDATVYIGLVTLFLGVVCFLIEIEGYTWVFHGTWHLLAFTGFDLVMYGTTEQLPSMPVDAMDLNVKRDLQKAYQHGHTFRLVEMGEMVMTEGLAEQFRQFIFMRNLESIAKKKLKDLSNK